MEAGLLTSISQSRLDRFLCVSQRVDFLAEVLERKMRRAEA